MVLDWSPLTYPDLQLFSPSSPVLLPSSDLPAPGVSEDYEETRVVTNPDIYNDINYKTNYHYNEGGHHLQQQPSLIGEVTPSKIENNIESLSTDQDADGEDKRPDV